MLTQRSRLLLIAQALCFGLLCTQCSTGISSADDSWDAFGGAVPRADALSLAELLDQAESFNGQDVVLEATVAECCQNKGCWMTLVDGDRSVRVKFLDYAFFVPLDSAGRTVRLSGVFSIRDVPVEEARHYLEDAGRHEEAAAITEPQRSYEIMASGVLLADAPAR